MNGEGLFPFLPNIQTKVVQLTTQSLNVCSNPVDLRAEWGLYRVDPRVQCCFYGIDFSVQCCFKRIDLSTER